MMPEFLRSEHWVPAGGGPAMSIGVFRGYGARGAEDAEVVYVTPTALQQLLVSAGFEEVPDA